MSNRQYVAVPLPSPYCFQCTSYTAKNGEKDAVTVVIVPVNFTHRDVFTWSVGWSCNFGKYCKCKECVYSYKERGE
jgi:hypothetical protein